jgi:hypothetical protein
MTIKEIKDVVDYALEKGAVRVRVSGDLFEIDFAEPGQGHTAKDGEESVGRCSDCGAFMKISRRSGKPYCGAKCWLNRKAG